MLITGDASKITSFELRTKNYVLNAHRDETGIVGVELRRLECAKLLSIDEANAEICMLLEVAQEIESAQSYKAVLDHGISVRDTSQG